MVPVGTEPRLKAVRSNSLMTSVVLCLADSLFERAIFQWLAADRNLIFLEIFAGTGKIGCSEDLPYSHAWIPAATIVLREFEIAKNHTGR